MRQCRCRDRYDYVGVDMCGDVDVERDRCDYVGVDMCGDVDVETGAIM